jgi:phosphoribosylformylglycinamidine synthase
MKLTHFFRTPGFTTEEQSVLLHKVRALVSADIESVGTEFCFNVETNKGLLVRDTTVLFWLLRETFEPEKFGEHSFLEGDNIIEVGPRLSFSTAWSTNAVSVCHSCGLKKILRIERSRRYQLNGPTLTSAQKDVFLALVHDRMTECQYPEPLTTFETGVRPEKTFEVPVMEEGRTALERINREAGLAFDEWDLSYYTRLFRDEIGRNPTNVECFDIAQSNSEHSRHWFFKGKLIIDGKAMPEHLMELLQKPLKANPNNSASAFKDNSSSIRGYRVPTILPAMPGEPSPFGRREVDYDILFTAETHNFPSGVAPFPGAETGTGGRIRDTHATGRGSLVVAGTAAYCVGNLNIPGYPLPWEDASFQYPSNLASPLKIEIDASNGASDYGNKFGEPVIQGYTRSFGMRLGNGERREWIKPIMFSGGIGQMDARHRDKFDPEVGMLVVKIGGPAYRIGMGGGAASSMVQGENVAELDFNAVQRGDAEMEQKVNRVIRACVELGDFNPIISIHDQGAGGNCNVLKEIVDPAGAQINVREIPVGDETLSVLEIWGAEYQENDALLLKPEQAGLFQDLCEREKVTFALVGKITGDGRAVLFDKSDGSLPVDLELSKVLGKMPQKEFRLERVERVSEPLNLPNDITVKTALERVLRLVSVGSKRFLTNKVDRCVTGLVARQQCAGPLQLTVADVAVIAQSHFGVSGGATAIGEKPVIGLLDPAAMGRMVVGEALTNLVWARVSALQDVKCSGNWMWAAKLPGEGAAMYDAAVALKDTLLDFGIAIDGGKDSLSMAALAPDGRGGEETVKAPGSLVISAYVTCPDVTKAVTPDLKSPVDGRLLYVDLGGGRTRLGGSSLAHAFGQLGDGPPDLDDPALFRRAFETVQDLVAEEKILSGHDRSDGGLVTTVLEMAFAGNCGVEVSLDAARNAAIPALFSEELGLVLEVSGAEQGSVVQAFEEANVPCAVIGRATEEKTIEVKVGGETVLSEEMELLRDLWEETSYQVELLQANPECVEQERSGLGSRPGPEYRVSFEVEPTSEVVLRSDRKPQVAIVREEGSNGDREMTSAFFAAGFEPWDVTMSDLLTGGVSMQDFRGVVFVGGFSYADVLDSAKGWAGVIRHNPKLWDQFQDFYLRQETFSLGVCNGCQLMALLGWVPWPEIDDSQQPRFIHNSSGRFESRFSTVQIQESPALMLEGMAGSSLGVWVAHGEGRAFFPDQRIYDEVIHRGLAPVRFVDDQNQVTESYPENPNGSPGGIAGLCSPDGRHLVMMPHPERTFLKWQWGWMPEDWKRNLKASPWIKMFQNARQWCEGS